MKLDWFVAVYDTKYSKESVTNPWPRNSMSWSLPLKLWKLFHAINFGWREDSSLASGGDNQCLTSPSCNPLRLAKHAANNRSNFHYCKIFICEFWSMDLLRKQTLFSICRCRSTQILKTVKSQKIFEMLLRQWTWWARGCLPPSGFDHSSDIWHILPPLLRGTLMSQSVWETVFVKFIR